MRTSPISLTGPTLSPLSTSPARKSGTLFQPFFAVPSSDRRRLKLTLPTARPIMTKPIHTLSTPAATPPSPRASRHVPFAPSPAPTSSAHAPTERAPPKWTMTPSPVHSHIPQPRLPSLRGSLAPRLTHTPHATPPPTTKRHRICPSLSLPSSARSDSRKTPSGTCSCTAWQGYWG
jgi:hypothetical protein